MNKDDIVLSQALLVSEEVAAQHDGSVILLSRTGSRAYGAHNESSDHDFRGVYLADLSRVLSMGGVKDSIDLSDPHDVVVYELAHFCRLAAKANPTALETLWSPFIESSALGDCLIEARDLFLSKRVLKTYGGYALSQIDKAKKGTGGSRGKDHHKRMKFRLHTLRLLVAGIHVLRFGDYLVEVEQPDLLISESERGLEHVEERAIELLAEMDEAASKSALPNQPNYAAINDLIYNLRMEAM